jgi:hypothetical protein
LQKVYASFYDPSVYWGWQTRYQLGGWYWTTVRYRGAWIETAEEAFTLTDNHAPFDEAVANGSMSIIKGVTHECSRFNGEASFKAVWIAASLRSSP